jgi:predicted RNase H-like nuclease
MANVAGVDGTPRGWAVVFNEGGDWRVENVSVLSHLFDGSDPLEIVAIDVPIGLLQAGPERQSEGQSQGLVQPDPAPSPERCDC